MLRVENLDVEVDGRKILENLSIHIGEGEVHVLFGPNGSGKTTLLMAILGFPSYRIKKGRIIFKGKDITYMDTDRRVKMGMGIAFQHPPEIKGVKLADIMGICMGRKEEGVTEDMIKLARKLKIPESFLYRDVNSGFSGGETKRTEILQLISQNPDFMMFDEPDSGVDVENIEVIGKIMNEVLERNKLPSERRKSGLIITHMGYILNYVKADRAHVMLDGNIACSGTPEEIFTHVMKEGFEDCIRRCGKGRK